MLTSEIFDKTNKQMWSYKEIYARKTSKNMINDIANMKKSKQYAI